MLIVTIDQSSLKPRIIYLYQTNKGKKTLQKVDFDIKNENSDTKKTPKDSQCNHMIPNIHRV